MYFYTDQDLIPCICCSEINEVRLRKPFKCRKCGGRYVVLRHNYKLGDSKRLEYKESLNINIGETSNRSNDLLEFGVIRFVNSNPHPVLYLGTGDPSDWDVDPDDYGWYATLVNGPLTKDANIVYHIYGAYFSDLSRKFYHGTPFASEIMKDGELMIPRTVHDKQNGFFNSEYGFRYVGVNEIPAACHVGKDGKILLIRYFGWVLKTNLAISSHLFRLLFSELDNNVCAIEYFEDGRSVVFSENARLWPAGYKPL